MTNEIEIMNRMGYVIDLADKIQHAAKIAGELVKFHSETNNQNKPVMCDPLSFSMLREIMKNPPEKALQQLYFMLTPQIPNAEFDEAYAEISKKEQW